MNEAKLLRLGAIFLFTAFTLGLAWSLGATIKPWLGCAVGVLVMLPVALRLISMEHERLESSNRQPTVEPWIVPADEQV